MNEDQEIEQIKQVTKALNKQQKLQEPHDDLAQAHLENSLLKMTNREMGRVGAIDGGTNLPNKTAYTNYAKKVYEEVDQFAFVFIDLNGFKKVNEMLGHPAGDSLLLKVGAAFRETHEGDVPATRFESENLAALGATTTSFRAGGDEFGMVLTYHSLEDAIHIADNMRRVIADLDHGLVYKDGSKPELSGSVGLVWVDAKQGKPIFDDLIQMVDDACNAAKNIGKDKFNNGGDMLSVALSPTEFYRVDDQLNLIPIVKPNKEETYIDRRAPEGQDRRQSVPPVPKPPKP